LKPTLVTGASGFIGGHVLRALRERGERVRAMVRRENRIAGDDVELVHGDLRDAASLARAVEGCRVVFHVAADYRLWVRNPRDMFESNVEGTRNLIQAARRAGVERFVYTSTVGCVNVPGNGLGDETMFVSREEMSGPYKRSKFEAEQVALEAARSGFPVVIVSPTAPIGDHDGKPTPTGKIVLDFLKGNLPAYIDTGLNLVDVRDVAAGHLLACEKGRVGERYILGAENLTLGEILQRLAAITGKPAPRVKLPYAVAYAAGVVTTAVAHFTGEAPFAPLDAVKMARKKMFVTHAKATGELGFEPGPVEGALQRAVDWFRDNGYV
jgi:dihydroflavonol-4-reductase